MTAQSVKQFCRRFPLIWLVLLFSPVYGQTAGEESCTIGVASGSATEDGRPLLWKTRDSSSPDNEVIFNTLFKYTFISVSNANDPSLPWMGVNEHGLSIVNSTISDLPTNSAGPGNGGLMRNVLGNCRTVTEFQHYLDSTNNTGRATHANYGVIDSTGAAAIFETGGSVYYKFDATGSSHGYVIRTNFTFTGGGTGGMERFDRSSVIIAGLVSGDTLNQRSILRYQMRDFSDEYSEPVPVPYPFTWSSSIPYGYIYCELSICRPTSVSAAVIHGVSPAEPAGLTTMWTILGQPATTVAVPYWPVGYTPDEADGVVSSDLCDKANELRALLFDYSASDKYINSYKLLDNSGKGLWSCLYPLEDSILYATEEYLDSIRLTGTLPAASMKTKEADIAKRVFAHLNTCMNTIMTGVKPDYQCKSAEIYPNPAVDKIYVVNDDGEALTISIYTLTGVNMLHAWLNESGINEVDVSRLSRGVYIIEIYRTGERSGRILVKL
jgi:hypothetical protein